MEICIFFFTTGLQADWSCLCHGDLKQFYTHLTPRQTPTLVCNLLFIARRQGDRDWERQITWSRFPQITTTTTITATSPILSRGHCVGKQMEWLPFVLYRRALCARHGAAAGWILYSVQNLNIPLLFRAHKPMTAAGRIVQIMMHGRDQIKIYQLRVGIHL